MDHTEITNLTQQFGGQWAIAHAQRILNNIAIIAEGKPYDLEAAWVAAYLHDWGGYPAWAVAGVDHALRSHQVAEQFLHERLRKRAGRQDLGVHQISPRRTRPAQL